MQTRFQPIFSCSIYTHEWGILTFTTITNSSMFYSVFFSEYSPGLTFKTSILFVYDSYLTLFVCLNGKKLTIFFSLSQSLSRASNISK